MATRSKPPLQHENDTLHRCRARVLAEPDHESLPSFPLEARGGGRLQERLSEFSLCGALIETPAAAFFGARSTPGAHGGRPMAGFPMRRPATPTFVSRRRRCRSLAVLCGSFLAPVSRARIRQTSAPGLAGRDPAEAPRSRTRCRTVHRSPAPACHRRVAPRTSRRPLARQAARTPHPAPPNERLRTAPSTSGDAPHYEARAASGDFFFVMPAGAGQGDNGKFAFQSPHGGFGGRGDIGSRRRAAVSSGRVRPGGRRGG